jgi:N-acetylneuraminate lyase
MKNPLIGLVAAPFTPLRADGSLALEIVPALAAQLARNGVKGAFICGTTGEGYSLTTAERRSVAEAWRAAIPPGVALIVHIGHLSLGEARALARHAQEIGADAVAAMAPSFFKPAGARELAEWCRAAAAAAPRLPFYYYHMPAMTGVTLSAAAFLAEAGNRIPTLAGVKFTHEDLDDYRAARALDSGRFDVLFGRDEILLSGLVHGARGAVGSTYNYAAPLYQRILHAYAAGDLATAQKAQAEAQAFIDIMKRHGGLAAGKAIMKLIGLDCGPVRLPLRTPTPVTVAALRADLTAIGFFDYASVV